MKMTERELHLEYLERGFDDVMPFEYYKDARLEVVTLVDEDNIPVVIPAQK